MLGRKRHCISNEDPKQRQSTVPWCLRGVTGPSQRPPSTRYKTRGPAPSDMDRSMLRQAGRHEKDIAKSETERLHCHLDVNSRSSRHCRVGYGGQNPRAHRASAAYVRNRHLNCCKNLRYNTADMSNPTSNYDILGCDDVWLAH